MSIIFSRKGQVALEFITLIMVGIVMVMVLIGGFAVIMSDSMTDKDFARVKDMGFEIQRELILASEVHEGYSREFFVPEYAGRLNYTVRSGNRLLVLRANDVDFPFPIPVIVGNVTKGHNTVKNVGGVVVVE